MLREITIKTTDTATQLATGLEGQNVFKLEGNWYFEPAAVDMQYLKITDRIYVCPHKGTCFWIDLDTPGNYVKDIAWVYTVLKPHYEYIRGRIGFYGGTNAMTREG
jgi:uncharacterized protein (DUF427 family)